MKWIPLTLFTRTLGTSGIFKVPDPPRPQYHTGEKTVEKPLAVHNYHCRVLGSGIPLVLIPQCSTRISPSRMRDLRQGMFQ